MADTSNLTYIGPVQSARAEDFEAYRRFDPEMGEPYPGAVPDYLAPLIKLDTLMNGDDVSYLGMHASHFSYVIHGEIFRDFMSNPAVTRLQRIKQLGTVTSTWEFYMNSSNTRYLHSLVVAMLGDVVLTKYGFDERSKNLCIAAAFLHDAATPPYSEQGKIFLPVNEEADITIVLEDESVRHLLGKYGILHDDFIRCVRGEYPITGRLINSRDELDLDRLAYTAYDVHNSLRAPGNDLMPNVVNIVREDPFVFDLYDDMRIKDGEVFFTNPERVGKVLRIRADMFRNVYGSPENRAREAFIRKEFKGLSGKIKKRDLIRMDDFSFEKFIGCYSVHALALLTHLGLEAYEIGRRDSIEEDEKARLEAEGFAVEKHKGFNPAIETKVMDGRNIRPFKKVMPETAQAVREIADRMEYVGIYRWDK